uniref:protein-tyrosine-phosphatase n=1 Tax=Pseudo-nitzschia australis TaxID=44445 RepID=A0A7S4ANI1_9STRA
MESDDDSESNKKKARLGGGTTTSKEQIELDEELYADLPSLQRRFATIRQWIAQPIDSFRCEDGVFRDPYPASIIVNANANHKTNETDDEACAVLEDTGVLIGNKYHASDVDHLVELGVTAVLNCASGGISRLPIDELRERGIRYGFTNVQQDDLKYPILHDLLIPKSSNTNGNGNGTEQHIDKQNNPDDTENPYSYSCPSPSIYSLPRLCASQHLKVAKAMYLEEVVRKKGKLLFFCVAGQNRSATLALATLLLRGKKHYTLDSMCHGLSATRPFVLENQGFQRQVLELERYLKQKNGKKKKNYGGDAQNGDEKDPSMTLTMHAHGDYAREDWIASSFLKQPTMSYDTVESYSSGTPPPPFDAPGDVLPARDSGSSPRSMLISSELESNVNDNANAPSFDTRKRVEFELLIPGLCTMEIFIPVPSSIGEVKECLVDHANKYLLKSEHREVAKSWVVLATFGKDDMYDLPLEKEAIERSVQWDRLSKMFRLKIEENRQEKHEHQKLVHWNSKCRFALVIFSVYCDRNNDNDNDNEPHLPTKVRLQEPWTFVHRERPGAPATLLSNTLSSTHLRAWDFCDGQAFCSKEPIVFSFSEEPGDRRQFMKISTSAQEAQQFHAPGEGGILGMGVNAIVHRVELKSTSPKSLEDEDEVNLNESGIEEWDAAVKRPFSLSKMLASLEAGSEAALGKRLRQLSNRSLLNSDGRVLYFYGLGVALSSNASRPTEYKFEATILARYEEEFSTYTMKRFMQDYTSKETPSPRNGDMEGDGNDDDWRKDFSLISVKVLLVSLLNAFRDLTLMGVQAFDFNHLGNVLISRDHQSVKLLDIDGDRKGSIPLSEYLDESSISLESQSQPFKTSVRQTGRILHKPSLDVDLNAVLPTVVQQLLLGKGRGTSFVVNSKSEIWRLTPHEAKVVVKEIISENFGPLMDSHMAKVVEWFYAMLKKQPPWGNWTHDIYDAMRCIDHLPVR